MLCFDFFKSVIGTTLLLCTFRANDVEAINEESFYFTNYLYTTNSILNIMELYMPMTWGSVFYWKEGQRPQLMINKLKQPNGITLSPDQKYDNLYYFN